MSISTTDDHTVRAEDLALAERMLGGDDAAFSAFFDGQFPALYRFTLARVRDPETTRDLVQTALCKALENLSSYRGEASLTTWVFTICRYEISGYFRRTGRAPDTVELSDESLEVGAALDALPARPDEPETDLQRRQQSRLVHWILDRLPPRYGQALEWKYLDGLPVKEIARRLEIGPKAAESLLTRARHAFRDGYRSLGPRFERWKAKPS